LVFEAMLYDSDDCERTSSSGYVDVRIFNDGSLLVEDSDFLAFASREEYFQKLSLANRPEPGQLGRIVVEGVLEESEGDYFDLPFVLTRMTCNGKPYLVRTTDWDDEAEDSAYIDYTCELAAKVGQRIKVEVTPGTFEDRWTERDIPYLRVPILRTPVLAEKRNGNHQGVAA
jgi:hypothetical protein